jgi:hypothetical protein
MEAILKVLSDAPFALRAGEWQMRCLDELAVTRRTFYNYRDELLQQGRITCNEHRYTVVTQQEQSPG